MVGKNIKKYFLVIFSLYVIGGSIFCYNCSSAIGATSNGSTGDSQGFTGVDIPGQAGSVTSYKEYVTSMLEFAKNLGLMLAILMLIYAGYKYMTSQGNPTAINEAKEITIGALTGFILLFLVYLITNILGVAI